MFVVVDRDRIAFRSTIRERAVKYRDKNGGVLYRLLYCDEESTAPAEPMNGDSAADEQ